MSGMGIEGKVGNHVLKWRSAPRGAIGQAQVEVGGKLIDVRWKRDADGIWIETESGAFGFDFEGEPLEVSEGRRTFSVTERWADGAWTGLAFLRGGESETLAAAGGQKKGARVRAQMPGKMIRILVKEGDVVARDQSVAVMEAMKMENEIRAPQAGKIKTLKVVEGQAVETGADLMVIEPLE